MVNKETVERLLMEYVQKLEKLEDYKYDKKQTEELLEDKTLNPVDRREYQNDVIYDDRKIDEFERRLNEIAIFFRENNINLEECLDSRTR